MIWEVPEDIVALRRPWPVCAPAPMDFTLPAPRMYAGETRQTYESRVARWRRWAADARPDLWFVSETEVLDWRRWLEDIGRFKKDEPTP